MIPVTPRSILFFQLLAHISIIPMIMYGGVTEWVISFFVYFLTGCLGMTMTYHRLLSHKSWKSSKWLEYLFVFFATIGLTGPAVSWVAIHRQHHAFSDTHKDPHSPKYQGRVWSHFFSMFAKVEIKYAAFLLKEKFYRYQHKFYFEINLIYAVILFLIDPFAVIYAWLFPAMILWNGGSSIISISHRNNKVNNDTSLALLVWGEGYHKNHHDHPGWSRFGKWDLAGYIIQRIRIDK